MALTYRERKALRDRVMEFIQSEVEERDSVPLTNKDIREQLAVDVHPATMSSIIEDIEWRLMDNGVICEKKWGKPKTYTYKKVKNVLTEEVEKVRNLLYFHTTDDKVVTYDFNTKEWSIPFEELYTDKMGSMSNILDLLDFEWIFNFIDLNDERIWNILYSFRREIEHNRKIFETCPKNLVNYMRENDEVFSAELVRQLYMREKFGFVGMNMAKTLEVSTVEKLMDKGVLKNLLNVFVATVKKGILDISYHNANCLAEDYLTILAYDNTYRLDENKSIEDNLKMINTTIDEKKNEMLAKKLQTLNFINGMTYNDLQVVVPQTQADKKAEGEMQHNCVGYYYDSSILRGENFIYFIRKANNVDKSYVTCRYNTNSKNTAEYRGFSNRTVVDNDAIAFIKKLDKIIKNEL